MLITEHPYNLAYSNTQHKINQSIEQLQSEYLKLKIQIYLNTGFSVWYLDTKELQD